LQSREVIDLPLWPSGVERDPSVAGVRLSPGASAYQRIISDNSYAHDEQGVNPGQVRGFDGVLYKLTIADVLISSVKVSAALT